MRLLKHHWQAGIIVLAYLALALIYGVTTPAFEHVDEAEHFGVIRYIAENGKLPIHQPSDNEIYHYDQEASQPPLYHLLSAGLTRLLGLHADDAEMFQQNNPWASCHLEATDRYDNRTLLYHNRETFPWHGTLLMLHVLRIWSTILQVITVIGTYALARAAFPDRSRLPLLAAAIVAFNPQFILTASGINNDNMLTPLVTLVLYRLFTVWRDGLSTKRAIGTGILIGLAGMSKLSGWLLLLLAGLVCLTLLLRAPEKRRQLAFTAMLIPAVALCMSGWWFWRNWQLYQDPLALKPMLAMVSQRAGPPIFFPEMWLMFRSFWGQIPCSFYPPAYYVFFIALVVVGIGGLAWGWRKFTRQERWLSAFGGAWFVLVVISWSRWNMATPAPWGRLVFPALPALAILLALGIHSLSPSPSLLAKIIMVAQALVAVWTAVYLLPAFYGLPRRYADMRHVRPQYPVTATFGQVIEFYGYDIDFDDRTSLLDLTLYWQALAPIREDYVLGLQMVSLAPEDTTLRMNYNSWPGRGAYPTTAWQPGEIIADRYRLHVPEADLVTQAWKLNVLLYRRDTGARLPLIISGQPADSALTLTTLRVNGTTPHCVDANTLQHEVVFGAAIALTHAQVVKKDGALNVTLRWNSRRAVADNFTVFVHLFDAHGTWVGTGDAPPMQGAFPTSLWQPGDVVCDTHTLNLPPDLDLSTTRIVVGLYQLESGTRLTAVQDTLHLPDDAVTIWPAP